MESWKFAIFNAGISHTNAGEKSKVQSPVILFCAVSNTSLWEQLEGRIHSQLSITTAYCKSSVFSICTISS